MCTRINTILEGFIYMQCNTTGYIYVSSFLYVSEIQTEEDQRSTHSAFALFLLKRKQRLPFAMSRLSASMLLLPTVSSTAIPYPQSEPI